MISESFSCFVQSKVNLYVRPSHLSIKGFMNETNATSLKRTKFIIDLNVGRYENYGRIT